MSLCNMTRESNPPAEDLKQPAPPHINIIPVLFSTHTPVSHTHRSCSHLKKRGSRGETPQIKKQKDPQDPQSDEKKSIQRSSKP
uniref:Uncharacterized protein n=1 Tax=Kalanchoe fedtschenkoi TaxID=63787 RepID=A0A7N0SY29_KALFE